MDWFFRFPKSAQIDISVQIDEAVRQFARSNKAALDAFRNGIATVVNFINTAIALIPWWLLILIVAFLAYKASKRIGSSILFAAMLLFVGVFGLWDLMLETLSIVIFSVVIALIIGFPLGILVALSERASAIIRPALDFMQTIPSFVYLIPAAMLLGVGKTPAVIATVIYSLVPMVRMTSHGIRHVDKEVVEAATAFGSTKLQSLIKVEIPQAKPTIMAGVNQTIMMAMAMVVTCALVGANGLGMQILVATNRVEIGRALMPGLAIVFIAIILDRLTQAAARPDKTGGERDV